MTIEKEKCLPLYPECVYQCIRCIQSPPCYHITSYLASRRQRHRAILTNNVQIDLPAKNVSKTQFLSTSGFTLPQLPLPRLQTLQSLHPILTQLRSPVPFQHLLKEPRPPRLAFLLSLLSLFALPLFELDLEFRGFLVSLLFYAGCDGLPEALGFVGELGGKRGGDLRSGEEWPEVYYGRRILYMGRVLLVGLLEWG